jgi:DNA polymerase-3 subunit delta'
MRIGSESVVGQKRVKEELTSILDSGRLAHAYLFSGPPGVGKKALALAFAEAINGITNLNPPHPTATSLKRSWHIHPDIHLFLPMPREHSESERSERISMVAEDPYAIVDFGNRPGGGSEGKNRNAFYSTEYYHDWIRPSVLLSPNEGERTVVVIANVELMRDNVANAFLKLLEEPPPDVVFLLVTDRINLLLPTILSRCQLIRCQALTHDEVKEALISRDGRSEADADYLARVTAGHYAMARYLDMDLLGEVRSDIVAFLRAAYTLDPRPIVDISSRWATTLNNEAQRSVLNLMEVFLRDVIHYRATGDASLLTNADQADIIAKFTGSLRDARLDEMIAQIAEGRSLFAINIQTKVWYTVLAFRFSALMRGEDPTVPDSQPWLHMPALA